MRTGLVAAIKARGNVSAQEPLEGDVGRFGGWLHKCGAQPGSEQQRTAAALHPSTVGAVVQRTKAANTVAHYRSAALCRVAAASCGGRGGGGSGGEGKGGFDSPSNEDRREHRRQRVTAAQVHRRREVAGLRWGRCKVWRGCGRSRCGAGGTSLFFEPTRGVAGRGSGRMRRRRRPALMRKASAGWSALCDVGGEWCWAWIWSGSSVYGGEARGWAVARSRGSDSEAGSRARCRGSARGQQHAGRGRREQQFADEELKLGAGDW